ncbi:MAG: GNAT family N-acetyltransferase [Kofleriaceae bacterium]
MVDTLAEVLGSQIGSELPWPDTRVIQREGWYQVITPSTRSAIANEVCTSRLTDSDADAVIDRTCAEYAAAGVPFKWFVGPDTTPSDMGRRLEARGFRGVAVRGMAIEPSTWRATVPDDVTVEEVTVETLDEYNACFAAGWSVPMPEAQTATLAAAIASGRFRMYVARIDGAAVGTCGLVVKPRSIYLVGGNVLPAYRRRGVYRAMLATRLASATSAGVGLAVTQAREESSAPILEALGFESVCSAVIYRNETDKNG